MTSRNFRESLAQLDRNEPIERQYPVFTFKAAVEIYDTGYADAEARYKEALQTAPADLLAADLPRYMEWLDQTRTGGTNIEWRTFKTLMRWAKEAEA